MVQITAWRLQAKLFLFLWITTINLWKLTNLFEATQDPLTSNINLFQIFADQGATIVKVIHFRISKAHWACMTGKEQYQENMMMESKISVGFWPCRKEENVSCYRFDPTFCYTKQSSPKSSSSLNPITGVGYTNLAFHSVRSRTILSINLCALRSFVIVLSKFS